MAERYGPSLTWWARQPWAFTLWAYFHLQETDRRRGWIERMRRIEAATLIAMAMHDPKLLDVERQHALTDAAVKEEESPKELLARAQRMADEIKKSGLFQDGKPRDDVKDVTAFDEVEFDK